MLACMLKGVSALARPASKTGLRKTALRASSPLSTFPLSDSTPTVPCSYAGSASDYEGDLLVIPFWQTADDAVRDFKGAKGSGCLVSVSKKRHGVGKVALYGLGKKDEAEGDAYRGLGAYAAETAREQKAAFVGVAAPSRTRDAWRDVAKVEALVLGCHEANYVDNRFRTGKNVKESTALEKLLLVDEPPDADDAAPDDAYADSLLSETPYEDVEKAGGAAAIAAGASSRSADEVRHGRSAATLGCAAAVAGLGVDDVEVHFIVAACENMISQDAMRPGDVLTASNGKTIEVINTDAEGRLTLADALVYAEALKPDAIVDLATLTGACVVALGDDVAGLFSKDDALASELEAAASSAMEQVWRMPMPPAYEKDIESTIADLKNAGEATGFGVKTMAQWVEARAAVPADAVF
ncbi:manganese ion binding protein [Aureococcus anophagefferens]|nr:manganese ion binding protein [Aureococcus anophagefferens]